MERAAALCTSGRLGEVFPASQQRLVGSRDGSGANGIKSSQDLVKSDVRMGDFGLTSRLQFGLDMCQSSLLAEGNLLGKPLGNSAASLRACALRKIKS